MPGFEPSEVAMRPELFPQELRPYLDLLDRRGLGVVTIIADSENGESTPIWNKGFEDMLLDYGLDVTSFFNAVNTSLLTMPQHAVVEIDTPTGIRTANVLFSEVSTSTGMPRHLLVEDRTEIERLRRDSIRLAELGEQKWQARFLVALPQRIFEIDEYGNILNRTGESTAENIKELLDRETETQFSRVLEVASATGESQHYEATISRNGVDRIFEARITPQASGTLMLIANDITVVRQAEIQRLEERSTEMLRFLQMIMHEIKHPLSAIMMTARLLDKQREGVTPDQIHQRVEELIKGARVANHMADTLMGLAAGNWDTRATDLHPVLNDIRHYLDPHMFETHKLEIVDPKDLEPIEMDGHLFRHVLSNLVNNSAKYSEAGTEIKVWVEQTAEETIFAIADQGFGIPKDKLPHIFDLGRRVHTQQRQDIDGFGVGLFIVKYIVDKHQGRIEVESEVGKGTTIKVVLPNRQKPLISA